ncbi:TetR/AcrR family transcriptional regulator [Blastococcus sp. TF02A_35]|uniref:TetR/AcrR family transcriptional regulator n=1 Tax=Blastococcus sp. TF02A-35 TaxID=2559612 RepID=UPI001ADDC29C|nr:TetR/AcrR family transcriptional regulator [Blastococcus sp. TF02A_35]
MSRSYAVDVPRLWSETIEEHRQAVRDATLDATATLVAEHGLASVTMSQIAEATGIGRATLYRHFSDVEAILGAWHERQIDLHLERLAEVGNQPGSVGQRLAAALETYAHLSAHSHGADMGAVLHRAEHVVQARHRLRDFLRDLIAEGVAAGELRADIPAEELATFCLHALGGAREMPSQEGVRRLVAVTVNGLRPPH